MAFLLTFYVGNVKKTAKIVYFDVLNTLTIVLCKFHTLSHRVRYRDILGQYWNIEIFAPWNGVLKIAKMPIFEHFSSQNYIAIALNNILDANFVPPIRH